MSADDITEAEYLAQMHDMERRAVAESRACESIPTKALEDGVVEKMVALLERAFSGKDGAPAPEWWGDDARTLLQQIKGDQT